MTEFNYGDNSADDAADVEEVSSTSLLADLKEEFLADTDEDIRWYTVTERPDIEVAFSTNIDYDLLKTWFKRATEGKGQRKTFNPLKLAFIIMTNQTRGIKSKGRVVGNDDHEFTLVSEEWWRDVLSQVDNQYGIRKLFKSEGRIMAQSQKIIEDAGYGDVDIEDGETPFGRG